MSHLRCGFRCLNRRTWRRWFCQVDSGHGGSVDFTPLGKQQTLSSRQMRHASSKDKLRNPTLSSLFERFKQKYDRLFWAAEKDRNTAGSLTRVSSLHRFICRLDVILFFFLNLFSFNSYLLNFLFFRNTQKHTYATRTDWWGSHCGVDDIYPTSSGQLAGCW